MHGLNDKNDYFAGTTPRHKTDKTISWIFAALGKNT